MAGKVKVYSKDLKALGSTSKAFSITKTEELMREFTLSFSIVNDDSVYPLITEDSVLEYQGQKFDISGIDSNSGQSNITQITAEHISYRLADYTIPNGYSFVGTIEEIANDILQQAKTVDEVPASTVFSIGTCADKGTVSFAMLEAQNVTAREALISMSELGVEIEFDNFTINVPEQRGSDNGMTFDFDRNLANVHRTWQKGNGWTYEVSIADLQKIPGHSGDTFSIGDYVTINDRLNKTVKKDRIISYTECDDPTQNRITIGVFIRDNATMAIETDYIANSALNTAENSIQQGEKYSNVSIDHTNGFMAVNQSGTLRVVMNADDCFEVQILQSGEWVKATGVDENGVQAGTLKTPNSQVYGIIGANPSGTMGLQLIDEVGNVKFCEIIELVGGGMLIMNNNNPIMYVNNEGTTVEFHGATKSSKVECRDGGVTLFGESINFKNLAGANIGGTGTINIANTPIITVKNGLITDWY